MRSTEMKVWVRHLALKHWVYFGSAEYFDHTGGRSQSSTRRTPKLLQEGSLSVVRVLGHYGAATSEIDASYCTRVHSDYRTPKPVVSFIEVHRVQ